MYCQIASLGAEEIWNSNRKWTRKNESSGTKTQYDTTTRDTKEGREAVDNPEAVS
jgi:hypothetical protein